MKKSLRAGALSSLLALAAGPACAQNVVPQPMPTGFNFPTPGYVIEQWVNAGQTSYMRGHGWDVWAAMGQPTDQSYSPDGGKTKIKLPVWDTWQSDNELFPHTKKGSGSDGTKSERVLHPFHLAHQQTHLPITKEPEEAIAISFNKFDPTAAGFILTKQPAPDGSGNTFPINQAKGLEGINSAWPEKTPVGMRAIASFPATAIETKPVFFPVLKAKLTAVPLWQGESASSNAKNPTPDTWTHCVLVDASDTSDPSSQLKTPTAVQIAEAEIPGNFNCDKALLKVAPIGMFYAVTLNKEGAATFASLQGTTKDKGLTLKAGDFAVLTAMHVNTKELDRWTWQTFYWQGQSRMDVAWPGTLGDVSPNVPAPFSSYAMCTAYDQVIGGQRVTCFNPYLETSPQIPDGINSNCVSCHGMAAAGSKTKSGIYPPTYTDNNLFKIPVDFSDPLYFGGLTKTDFSWAVAGSGSGTKVKSPDN